MVEAEVVRQMRELLSRGWGAKRVARELGVARNTVRRYQRGGPSAEVQTRPGRRALDESRREQALRLFEGTAEGNAVVVRQLLESEGCVVSLRTVQRAVQARRRELRMADAATVRYETAPGRQMQIDFGQKRVLIGGKLVTVHLLVAVLSYSRRLFVKAFLSERQDDWREGIAQAFRHFGGVPRELLGDNARALVSSRDRAAQTVVFHPGYLAFCKDWDVQPRACGPYRARTKGKTESGVKYVKRNALAGREFESFAALERHLSTWMTLADRRIHGTTHEQPAVRFERAEKHALRPLPERPLPARDQRLQRKVANDAFVDVHTVRYSVPYRFVREHVEVAVGEQEVRVFFRQQLVASHRRSFEPFAIVRDPIHFDGLWRSPEQVSPTATNPNPLSALGRSLADYEAVLAQEAA